MKPLVLLHGFTGAPASFDELCALLCERTGGALAVCRPPLLGHGAAAGEVRTFDDEIMRLATELEGRGLSGAHLCGYSLGARVGLGLITRAPRLFASATLIGVHPGLATEAARSERRASDERWARLLEEQGLEVFLSAWQEQPLFASQARLERAGGLDAVERQRTIRDAHDATELARALRVLGLAEMPSYRATLLAPPVPTTLVVGAHDTKFLALAREREAHGAGLKLEVVDGAGHNVVLEAPERLVEILLPAVRT
jgi:2-succinyl-6-hydroxy-2,4-cyclohexadiene-1-carboxylate synthase